MKLYICFCRSLNECFRDSVKLLFMTLRLPKQIIFKSKNRLNGLLGMQFAASAPCQKFMIGERNEQN
jgi:hypothetical protein